MFDAGVLIIYVVVVTICTGDLMLNNTTFHMILKTNRQTTSVGWS
jgi:hypothetical protein